MDTTLTNTNEFKLPRISQLRKWRGKCFLMVLLLATRAISPAQTFTTLVDFNGANGAFPGDEVFIVQGLDGNLWGTTTTGSTLQEFGTIFKISMAGALTTAFIFESMSAPMAGLTLAPNGDLYGTTYYGGTDGDGLVFAFSPKSGMLTQVGPSFDGSNGTGPTSGLVRAFNGTFYGTTGRGGANDRGTVFQVAPNGEFSTVYNGDSIVAYTTPIQGGNGNLYGTSPSGGTNSDGAIFELTPAGILTILHSFNGADGQTPFAGLVQGAGGAFYGNTNLGGVDDLGTIFKITPAGAFVKLHSFRGTAGHYPDGYYPAAALAAGSDGNLYGTTTAGGESGNGTIFRITPSGAFTTLYSFDSTSASNDSGGMVQATDGNFYGTLSGGGANGEGIVYRFSVGLSPFVKTLPAFGKVGSVIEILGTDLTGATSVMFNGTSATFTVRSASLITATVPAGAISGPVEVTTPSGALLSNVAFSVR
jgi:uncharacterized repeat protein (TIGR03803 family)